MLQHYRKPALGRSRCAFVHWAHRVAAAPTAQTPQPTDGVTVEQTVDRDLVRRMEQPEGLEFVVSWSIWRVGLALLLVGMASMAAALLWIFLGRSSAPGGGNGGFHSAGDRVGAGVVVGICVLLLGISGFGGWLGVSWLIM